MEKTVLVSGTGTIGEPLIGLLCDFKKELNVKDVLFYKRTPLKEEISKVESLISRGAHLVATDLSSATAFGSIGNSVSMVLKRALEIADVVVDCTPAGNRNRDDLYLEAAERRPEMSFIAQGSEKGFGMPYAFGINDSALIESKSKFSQVVSCNTHNISCLLKTFGSVSPVVDSDFVCIRRANDISQDKDFISSPSAGSHTDEIYGTHHARDVADLFRTLGEDVPVYSSALKVNTQYMHTIRFSIEVQGRPNIRQVVDALQGNEFIALTYKKTSNKVFSFGRDHGYYGRIFNQTVIPLNSISLKTNPQKETTKIVGFCFTPQDGNSLLSSMAAVARNTWGKDYLTKMSFVENLLFKLI